MTAMRPYLVALAFGAAPTGSVAAIGVIAPSAEAACAAAAATVVQTTGVTAPISGHHCQELDEGFLVQALAAVRGEASDKVVALSVVPKVQQIPRGPWHRGQEEAMTSGLGADETLQPPRRWADPQPHAFYPRLMNDGMPGDPLDRACAFCGGRPDDPQHLEAGE